MTVSDMAPLLRWTNPAGATQYQVQVIPFRDDGPGINLIRNADTSSYQVDAPVFGTGNYVMLPGMTYTWRVRTTRAATAVGENDSSWGPWTARRFLTAPPSSAGIRLMAPTEGSTTPSRTPTLTWDNTARNVFYYEVQVSQDPAFNTDPRTATASVYMNLIHGGQSTPANSYAIPTAFPLEAGSTYFWHVRPRVQGDGAPVAWSTTWTFRTASPSAMLGIEQANQTFRTEVATALQEAARQAGVTVRADSFVAIPFDNGNSVVVNVAIAGLEDLSLDQLAQGADALFTFQRTPQGSALPSGFYTVRIFRMATTMQWRAQFKDIEGRVALETHADVGPGDPGLPKGPLVSARVNLNGDET